MRVLVAEDDPISRHVLYRVLSEWGYEVSLASDGNQAWDLLQGENAPPVAILDWVMPGMDGIDLCRRIRERGEGPYVYILMLTSKHERQNIVQAMQAGADDYVSKPFDEQELLGRLRAGQRIVELQQALQLKATHDSLSGIWNREAILDILEKDLARSVREHSCVGLAIADLDHFKRINDTYGHLVGDAVLRDAARVMRASLRFYDSIGRYGGEEFLFVLPGSDGPTAIGVAERTRVAVSESRIETPAGLIGVTVSIGVTATARGAQIARDSLLRIADEALYKAKARGRNRVESMLP